MELRFRIALVTGAGGPRGHDVAVRLARTGAGVLVADPDQDAAARTAEEVRRHRVWSTAVQVDTLDEDDVRLLAARVQDLGGVALVLDTVGGPYAALLRDLLASRTPPPHWVDARTLEDCTGQETLRLLRAG